MNEIEWIKSAVGVCINNQIPEKQKSMEFEMLNMQYEAFSAKEMETIRKIIKAQFDVKDSIYFYSVLLRYMSHEIFAEAVIDALLECDFDVYEGSMLEVQMHKHYRSFSGIYQKVRMFHRKNVMNYAQLLGIDWQYRAPSCRNKNRIVIVTEQLLLLGHAPTRTVLSFAYTLKQMGYEILIFACPSDACLPEDLWYMPMRMNSDPAFENMPAKWTYQDSVFEGYQIHMTEAGIKEYHMMFSLIYAWNPAFVLDLGTMNPVVDLAAGFTTLVSCEMSIVCPVSEGQILIRLGKSEEWLEKKYKDALEEGQSQLYLEEKLPVMTKEKEGICTREELGLPEHQFLAAIVGNRLDIDVRPEFVSVMEVLLKKIPELIFVVIGKTVHLKEQLAKGIFENRVYDLGYRNDLMEVYHAMDLYLNPDRTGGGFSSAMALMAGVPVVTLPNCDVSHMAGEEFTVPDYQKMIETVCEYARNKEFYEKKAEKAQAFKAQNTGMQMEKYLKKLLDGIYGLISRQEEEL